MSICKNGAIVTGEDVGDDRLCSFVINLILRCIWLEDFVKKVNFALEREKNSLWPYFFHFSAIFADNCNAPRTMTLNWNKAVIFLYLHERKKKKKTPGICKSRLGDEKSKLLRNSTVLFLKSREMQPQVRLKRFLIASPFLLSFYHASQELSRRNKKTNNEMKSGKFLREP